MRNSVAKKLRKVASRTTTDPKMSSIPHARKRYQSLKKIWNALPRTKRHAFYEELKRHLS